MQGGGDQVGEHRKQQQGGDDGHWTPLQDKSKIKAMDQSENWKLWVAT
jgi:hypothetical protein